MPPPEPTTVQHALDGVGYRLIELPDELVNSADKDGLARLAAGGKSYAMRQKNTSNSLVLLTSAAQTQTLTAVATVHETVELIEDQGQGQDQGQDQKAPAAAAPKAKNRWHEKFGRTR